MVCAVTTMPEDFLSLAQRLPIQAGAAHYLSRDNDKDSVPFP